MLNETKLNNTTLSTGISIARCNAKRIYDSLSTAGAGNLSKLHIQGVTGGKD